MVLLAEPLFVVSGKKVIPSNHTYGVAVVAETADMLLNGAREGVVALT